jgi:hypothetical protein
MIMTTTKSAILQRVTAENPDAAKTLELFNQTRAELAKDAANEYGLGPLGDTLDTMARLNGEYVARHQLETLLQQLEEENRTPAEIENRVLTALSSMLLHATFVNNRRSRIEFEGIRSVVSDYRWAISSLRDALDDSYHKEN